MTGLQLQHHTCNTRCCNARWQDLSTIAPLPEYIVVITYQSSDLQYRSLFGFWPKSAKPAWYLRLDLPYCCTDYHVFVCECAHVCVMLASENLCAVGENCIQLSCMLLCSLSDLRAHWTTAKCTAINARCQYLYVGTAFCLVAACFGSGATFQTRSWPTSRGLHELIVLGRFG